MNWKETIYSDSGPQFISNPYPKMGETVRILLRVIKNQTVQAVLINYLEYGEEKSIPMEPFTKCDGVFGLDDSHFNYYDYYTVKLAVKEHVLQYYFTLGSGEGIYYYTQRGVTNYHPRMFYAFKVLVGADMPQWLSHSVFYQIFPDRFNNADDRHNVRDNDYTFEDHPTVQMNWADRPKRWEEVYCLDFYNGDLKGVEQKIDYLQSLGVNAIYINPIFRSASSHRYDCVDYFNVDPALGGNEALISLSEALHDNDMKIMVDVSVNHTGAGHCWFNKEGTFFEKTVGAFHNQSAPERDYYLFDETGGYRAWWHVPSLPELNYQSAALRDIIYESPNNLFAHWLKAPYNIDGWRLDVANEMGKYDGVDLSDMVHRGVRKAVKDAKSDAYLIGEEWIDPYEHLQGTHWDSAMNYIGCARPIRQFYGDRDLYIARQESLKNLPDNTGAEELVTRIVDHLASLPYQVQNAQFNLLGSHDTYRFHNVAGIDYDKIKGAVSLQFLLPGTPSIYYGDEIGLDGWVDSVEGCRFPMDWQLANSGSKLKKLYQTLARFKRTEALLHRGSTRLFAYDHHTLMLTRFDHQGCVLLIATRADQRQTIMFDSALIGDVFIDGVHTDLFGTVKGFEVTDQLVSVNLKERETLIFRFGEQA